MAKSEGARKEEIGGLARMGEVEARRIRSIVGMTIPSALAGGRLLLLLYVYAPQRTMLSQGRLTPLLVTQNLWLK